MGNLNDTNEALMEAAEDGNLKEVKALIKARANVNAVDDFKETALMKAAEGEHLEVMKVLIEASADVNAVDNFKETALMQAAEEEHLGVIKVLIEAGADVNAVNSFKKTALMLASENKHVKVVNLLLEAGANDNAMSVFKKVANKKKSDVNIMDALKKEADENKYDFKEIITKLALESTFSDILLKLVLPFVLLRLIFIVGGMISPFYEKITCTNRTIVEVVDVVKSNSRQGDSSYISIFSYNANGEQIIISHDSASSASFYEIGDTFMLFYNSRKPEHYYIKGLASGNWSADIVELLKNVGATE